MADAVGRVLGITELLDHILTHLPPLDLLRMKGISKEWQSIIQRSDTMQRKLFLKAEASERVTWPDDGMCRPLPGTLGHVYYRRRLTGKLDFPRHHEMGKTGWVLEIDCNAKRTI